MQVGFYQLGNEPAENAIAKLAFKILDVGGKMLVVSDSEEQLARISRKLWEASPPQFLANGRSGEAGAKRQPILLSGACEPENGAGFILMADGVWRDEALQFDRAMLLFDDSTIQDARACWRRLDGQENIERKYSRLENERWVEGP